MGTFKWINRDNTEYYTGNYICGQKDGIGEFHFSNGHVYKGLEGFYFVAYSLDLDSEYEKLKELGFDAICSSRISSNYISTFSKYVKKIISVVTDIPRIYDYRKMIPIFMQDFEQNHDDVFPTLIPNWDHTPRSKEHGYLYTHATPEEFQKHCEDVLSRISHKPTTRQIAFLKSWNEWGEGNYID